MKKTKSGKRRTVDLDASTPAELHWHRAAQAAEHLRLGLRANDDSFIFAQVAAKPIMPGSRSGDWRRAIAKPGLRTIRFHDLRHSHATQMLASDLHPKVAQERLGHSTIAITLDPYLNVMPGMEADAAEQVDAALRQAVNARGRDVRWQIGSSRPDTRPTCRK